MADNILYKCSMLHDNGIQYNTDRQAILACIDYDSFQRFRGCVVASQLTVAPSSSASSWVLSSVARSKFFRESCTSAAFLSFFSSEGSAAFFGGEIYRKRSYKYS